MIADLCVFLEEVPDVEIRGDIAFVTDGSGKSVALTVATLQKFIARCNRKLDVWHEIQTGASFAFQDNEQFLAPRPC
ncbi:MAG TPA: hypothetical protein VM711_07370 [Sphingomicrobium sp.]|nr:hypothetical protein [Sphingomicrobium sp.]